MAAVLVLTRVSLVPLQVDDLAKVAQDTLPSSSSLVLSSLELSDKNVYEP